MKKLRILSGIALALILAAGPALAADQTIKATEEMVGSGHATKADTLNRLALIEHNTDGTHKKTLVQGGGAYSLTDGATIAIDWNNGNTQYVILQGTGRAVTFANPAEGQVYRIVVIQDGTGSRTITTWPTIKWAGGSAPTLTTTLNKADVVTLLYANGGYYADIASNF